MSSSRGKKVAVPASKKRNGASSSSGPIEEVRHPFLRFPIGPQEELFQILWARPLIAGRYIDWAVIEQTVMMNFDDPGTVQFRLGGLVCQLSVPEFRTALVLGRTSTRWGHLQSYPSKASAFPPSLRYLHAILAHTITGKRESTGVINTHDAYFLWSISHGHIIDLAYFIALVIQHQTEWHRNGVISIGPYVTRLA
ncbi:hypothetical protein GOBAR_AA10810 [Gossypium barbadense]|uniref:Uncharacterized protein n=1 Tax=Gossypium barbadense TaxID=3634 RepID=A0A2P5Y2P6_GOSBA|nr:hypothetical protein GOBAR_AA10810 [Gossypium barbadense]